MPRLSPRTFFLFAAGAVVTATTLGMAFMPYLVVHEPLLLLALNPWPRHQILVAPHVALLPFLIIVTLRSLVAFVVAYELALRFGPEVLQRFVQGDARGIAVLRKLERWFQRASLPMLVLVPGPLTAAFAALFGMSRVVTFPALLAGQLAWAYAYHRLGGVLAPWTKQILEFFAANLGPATLICLLAVAAYQWQARRIRLKKAAEAQNPRVGT